MMNDWIESKIEDVISTSSGGTPKRDNASFYKGDIPWIKTGELKQKYITDTEEHITESALKNSSAKLFPKNTVILAMYGATIGNSSIIATEASTNQACCAFLPSEELYYEFLYYKLIHEKQKIISLGAGGAQPNISQKIINKYRIRIPPIKEQQKIATILSSVDEAIEKTEQIIEQTETVKKGLMQQLLTKGIGHTEFKTTSLGELPEKWSLSRLNHVGYTFSGLTNKSKNDFENHNSTKYVTYLNIFNNTFTDLKNLGFVFVGENEKQSELKYGDVLFTGSSETPNEIAMSSVIPQDVGKIFLNSFCFGYRFYDTDKHIPEFYGYYFRGNLFRNQVYPLAQGSTRFNLSKNRLSELLILVPPKQEQIKIASILSDFDGKILKEKERSTSLNMLKKGLMQQLLTGKVRVPINEDEEVPS